LARIYDLAQEAEATIRELTCRFLNEPKSPSTANNEPPQEVEATTSGPAADLSYDQVFFLAPDNEPLPDSEEESFPDSETMAPGVASSSSLTAAPSQPGLVEWTPEKDLKLYTLRKSGMKWGQVCGEFPGRSSRACQDRYIDCLIAKINEPSLYYSNRW
jgi:hypothetical protein